MIVHSAFLNFKKWNNVCGTVGGFKHRSSFKHAQTFTQSETGVKHETIALGFHLQQLAPGGRASPKSSVSDCIKCIQLFKSFLRFGVSLESLVFMSLSKRQGELQTQYSATDRGWIIHIHVWGTHTMFWHLKVVELDLFLMPSVFNQHVELLIFPHVVWKNI